MTANPFAESEPLDAPAAPVAAAKEPFWLRHRATLALVAILIFAAFFRFYGRDFDQDTHQHPDERFIVEQTMGLSWPQTSSQFFDVAHSPLNLRRDGKHYAYGSLPVYMTKAVAWAVDTYWPSNDYEWQRYEGVTKIGRMLAALFDLITVLLVFLIARRLYSRTAGLIAAALVAFAVTHIQIAHFYASDVFLVTFLMGALYFAVVLMQSPSWRAAVAVGLCIGLAVASKVSVVLFALIVVAAIVLRAAYRKRTRALGAEFDDPIGVRPASNEERAMSAGGHFVRGLRYALIAAVFALAAFAISEPYVLPSFDLSRFNQGGMDAVLKSSPFWGGIVEQAGIQSGRDANDVPYTRQYVGTVPILYHMQNLVFWGISPIPGVILVLGFLVGLWYMFRGRPAEILLMAGAIPYWATILTVETKWMRYVLPLVPIYCILAAAMLMRGATFMQKLTAGTSWLRTGRQPIVLLQRNLFPVLAAVVVGGALLWAIAFMNIYSQEHSRVQASRWIMDYLPTTISVGGNERPAIPSKENWDDELPLGVLPKEGEAPRQVGSMGPKTEFGLYDDRPPDTELEYIQELMAKTDYIFIASNRIYGSVRHLPWRYPVQDRFYELLYSGKLGFELTHTQTVAPALFGIQFNDQSADESFTVYDHPRVDVFTKTSDLTAEQLRTLFGSALTRPPGAYSTVRHSTLPDDKSLAYDTALSKQGDTGDYAWNPLAQPDTQWLGVLLWLLAIELIGLVALPLVFTICRNLPDRGYPLAKLTGLLLLAWGVWMVSSAKLVPFTIWGILVVLAVLAALSLLCWRLGADRIWRQFFATRRRLVIYYEVVFFLAFAAFIFIRMLNPDLWHQSLGGEKPMEFGFLNGVLRSPWMPPADPFFSQGYTNYYYYGQFVMGVLMKLVGIDPGLGVNVAIPMLFALTFTTGASIAYNIVAWSQGRRGSRHTVSRSGMVFGFLSGFLMLAIGNMGGAYEIFVIWFPNQARDLINLMVQLGFTEQFIRNPPPTTFDFWGPSRVVAHTINEFPFWSFLFADFHPHLIDMPFTLLVAALCLNLAFAGPFRSPAADRARVDPGSRIVAAFGWLWGEGWSGLLKFGVLAVVLGTLFATNSWDWPTFAAIAAGSAVIALLLAGFRQPATGDRTVSAAPDEPEEPEEPAVRRLDWMDRFSLWGTGAISIGLLVVASFVACAPFLLSFKNVLGLQIRPLIDGGPVQDNTQVLMHRTTLGEYLFMWLLFVFVACWYLGARLWAFPWRAAASDLTRTLGLGGPARRRSTAQPGLPSPGAALTLRPAHEGRLVPALAGAAPSVAAVREPSPPSMPAPMAFAAGPKDGEGLATETYPKEGDGFAAETYPQEDDGQGPPSPEAWPGTGVDAMEPQEGAAGEPGEFTAGSLGIPDTSALDATSTVDLLAGDGAATGNGHLAASPDMATSNWVADAHQESRVVAVAAERAESPGVIPLWAGLGMLGLTAALVAVQLATSQWLLALLFALAGGILATSLATSRSAAALYTGMLLFAALAVSIGVELVYLADHLRGGDMFRMNTVFKFYIQVWLLYGAGSAAAIYYILYGVRERVLGPSKTPQPQMDTDAQLAPAQAAVLPAVAGPADPSAEMPAIGPSAEDIAPMAATEMPAADQDTIPLAQVTANPDGETTVPSPASAVHDTGALPAAGADDESFTPTPRPSGPLNNWLVWSDEDATQPAQPAEPEQSMMPREAVPEAYEPVAYEPVAYEPVAYEPVAYEPVTPEPGAQEPDAHEAGHEPPLPPVEPQTYIVPAPSTEPVTVSAGPGLRITPGKIAFSVGFLILLALSLLFTWNGTIDRVSANKRFDQPPPFGTLDGKAYMKTGKFNPGNIGGGENEGSGRSIQIDLKYDYEGINWLNQNVPGLRVIAERPIGYYREGGMRVAANTGLPMVVGDLHQSEQRYDWLIGERNGDMRNLFTTQDPQVALTIMSKYDIDYIYLGQLEEALAGAGLAKFEQLADPKVGVLTRVFSTKTPSGIVGTTIYQVNKREKAPQKLVGAPVEGKGVAGISITPLPTATATPVPTPPSDNPQLKALIAAVAQDPNNLEIHMNLVNWYRDNNYWSDAARELDAIVKQRPDDIAVRHMLGDAYDQMGQKDNALKAWEDARDIDTHNAAAHNKVGVAYLDRHRFDDAEKEFQAATEADPAFTEAYIHLADVYLQKGQTPKARQALQSAIDKAKSSDDPWAKEARTRLANMK